MARNIPEDQPLSADDRQWLTDWGRFDTIRRIDEANGLAPEAEASIPEGELRGLLKSHGFEIGEDESTMDALKSILDGQGAGSKVEERIRLGDSAAHVAPNDAANGGSDDGDEPDDEQEPEDYTGEWWTKDRLQDELGRRELSKSGNKDELIERLLESDESGWTD